MTDDFQLFASPDDGEGPLDGDLALITAYLARELSPMQVLAVEERLITDADFRAAMQPLLDAWAAPVAGFAGAPASRGAAISKHEAAEAWRRFQREEATAAASAPFTNANRRFSMKRVAAVAAIVVLPVVSFAQAVVYSANHASAPGHELAQRIVAAFGGQPADAIDRPKVTAPIADVPVAHQLPAPALSPRPAARASSESAEPVIIVSEPDRAKVAALVKQHQPAVVRGDTAASYVIMVLDASGRYVWSTFGSGSWAVEVAGDPRTPAERARYSYEHRAQFGDTMITASGRGGAVAARKVYDTMSTRPYAIARLDSATGLAVMKRARGGDTSAPDSLLVKRIRSAIDSGAIAGRVVARGGGGARGGFVGAAPGDSIRRPSTEPGPYRAGFNARNGTEFNTASGLQEPGRGESGIQGLLAKNVSSADTYDFGAGSLAPRRLQVVVVTLVTGAKWNGR